MAIELATNPFVGTVADVDESKIKNVNIISKTFSNKTFYGDYNDLFLSIKPNSKQILSTEFAFLRRLMTYNKSTLHFDSKFSWKFHKAPPIEQIWPEFSF